MIIPQQKYIDSLASKAYNGLIKVVSGMRGVGKSFLLNVLFVGYLKSTGVDDGHIIQIDVEDPINKKFRNPFFLTDFVRSKLVDRKSYFLILEGIHLVKDYVPLLNGLLKIPNLDIYLSVSNTKGVLTEVPENFGGRTDELRMNISFGQAHRLSSIGFREDFETFSTYGFLPQSLNKSSSEKKEDYLLDLYRDIQEKDIGPRYKIRNKFALDELIRALSSHLGEMASSLTIASWFNGATPSKNTVEYGLSIFKEAMVINECRRYDVKAGRYLNGGSKYFFTDGGIRSAVLDFEAVENPSFFTNAVYNELVYRGFEVDLATVPIYFKNKKDRYVLRNCEAGFRIKSGKKIAYVLPIEKDFDEKRDLRPLLSIKDGNPRFAVVGSLEESRVEGHGIHIIGLEEFFKEDRLI